MAAGLTVEQQPQPTPGCATFGPPKSARSRRTVAQYPTTVTALRAHRDLQSLERGLGEDAYTHRDLVFADELGTPIDPTRRTSRLAKRRDTAGIATGTLHVLRHTAATIALTERIPVHSVAARLGDDPATVLTRTRICCLQRRDGGGAHRARAQRRFVSVS